MGDGQRIPLTKRDKEREADMESLENGNDCIKRSECQRVHTSLEKTLERMEKKIGTGNRILIALSGMFLTSLLSGIVAIAVKLLIKTT